jgi:uncharacterized protein YndB with AHSA1/START domain
MTRDARATEHVLRIERIFSARRERVFAAWVQPEMQGRWAPAGVRIGRAEAEIRVGGRFLTEMILAETDERHVVVGRYLEIDPPSRLRFTHGWLREGEAPEDVDARATTVTVEFIDEGPRTRMNFTQTGFPNEASRDGHREGWESSFENLDVLLSSSEDG